MTALFGWTFAVTVVLLLIVWLGPRVLIWVADLFLRLVNRQFRKLEERRQARHAEIREAITELERVMEARRDHE